MDLTCIAPLRQLQRNRRWQAAWIWDDSDHRQDNQYRLFRRVLTLDTMPAAPRLLISAGQQYRLWINGHFVGDGPAQSANHHYFYDPYEIGEMLQTGTNVICVQVRTLGRRAPAVGGLLCEVLDGDAVLDASGADWRVVHGEAWNTQSHQCAMNQLAPYQEHCDGRKLPWGWHEPDFDDSVWPAARCLRFGPHFSPWMCLGERDIPPLERQAILPVAVVAEEAIDIPHHHDPHDASLNVSMPGRPLEKAAVDHLDAIRTGADGCRLIPSTLHHSDPWVDGRWSPCLQLDYGEQVTACIEIEVTASAGALLEIGYAERLIDGYFNCTAVCHFADAYTCREGRQVFRFAIWRGFRYLRLRLRQTDDPVCLHALRAIRYRTPFSERGRFSGETRLEEVFDTCRKTIRICAVDALMDTPWREAGQWLGDVALVTVPGLYACFGDTSMGSRFYRQASLNQLPTGLISNLTNADPMGFNPIPDFACHYIRGLWRHYQYTGDRSWIDSFFGECRRAINWFLRFLNDDGLLEAVPCWVVIDWANIDKDGINCILNALFAGALADFQQMCLLIGDAEAAKWSGELVAHLRRIIPERFMDERGLLHDKLGGSTISEHANATAILNGCVSDEQAAHIIATLWPGERPAGAVADVVECQPFYSAILLEMLAQQGRQDIALRLIRERWHGRIVARGKPACPERWTNSGHPDADGRWRGNMSSESHAWSAPPAAFLLKQLAGIRILEPGCSRIAIQPYTGEDYAITFPLPQGDLRITVKDGRYDPVLPPGVRLD